MKLTKEQAIEGHRKMWNWIADEIERRKYVCIIQELKVFYCNSNNLILKHNCFCCEYNSGELNCAKCPLDWDESNKIKNFCENQESLYRKVTFSYQWEEQADLARQITNLPENRDVD